MYKLLTIIWPITAVVHVSIVSWSSSCRGNKHATTTAALFAESMTPVDISHSVEPYNVYLHLPWVSIMDQLLKNVRNIDLLTSC